jgi:curved DNA-binding protein CbpA
VSQLNPYTELGVEHGADAAAVRRAYRRRAKETHPDHGGDPAAFARTKRASVVLLDPAKRAKFDQEGVIDEDAPDNAVANAMVAIAQLLDAAIVQCVQKMCEPAAADLIDMMTRAAHQAKSNMTASKRNIAAHLVKSEALVGRFKVRKRKDQPVNRLAALIDQRIAAQRLNIAKIDGEIATLDRAIAMLADYSFDREQPHMGQGVFGLPNFGIRVTTT